MTTDSPQTPPEAAECCCKTRWISITMAGVVVGVAIYVGLYIRNQRRISEIGDRMPKGYLGEQHTAIPDVGTKEKKP